MSYTKQTGENPSNLEKNKDLLSPILEWIIQRPILSLCTAAGLVVGGLPGILFGALIGFIVSEKYNRTVNVVGNAKKKTQETIQHCTETVKKPLIAVAKKTKNVAVAAKDGINEVIQWEGPEEINPAPKRAEDKIKNKNKNKVKKTAITDTLNASYEFLDRMNGGREEGIYYPKRDKKDDPWMTRDINDLTSEAYQSVKSKISWLWDKTKDKQKPQTSLPAAPLEEAPRKVEAPK